MKAYQRTILCVLFLLTVFLSTVGVLLAQNSQAREYLRKAQVFLRSGNLAMARDFMQRAEKIDPEDGEIKKFASTLHNEINEKVKQLKQRAQFFLDARNVPEAEKLFNEVLELAAADEYAVSKLDEIHKVYEKIEDFKNQGIEVAAGSGRMHDIDLYSAISYLNRAKGLFASGDRVKALELVEEVLRREPNYKPALELKEQIDQINQLENLVVSTEKAFLEGRMLEAVNSLSRLIENGFDKPEYYLLRAKAFLMLKNFAGAEKDLWRFYQLNPDADKAFPLLSDAFFGQGKYLMALGFSKSHQTGVYYKGFTYRLRCHSNEYPWHYALLVLLCALIPISGYFVWSCYDSMSTRFPLGTLKLSVKCALTILLKSPEACLGDLIIVARDLNVHWINYLTAICLLKIGQIEGAQRFFTYSYSDDIKTRASYFMGLTRKMLNQRIQESDFEESVLSGLGKPARGWHPNFVKQIEQGLLISYSKEKSLETFEGMAYKLVSDQVGVLT